MTIIQALILGAVQGLTEFLPISSSGHLVLFDRLLHVSGNALALDAFLHAGTLLAVCTVYRRELWQLIMHPTDRMMRLLLVSTVPTVIIGLLFEKTFKEIFHSGATLGLEFMLTGTMLLYVERQGVRKGSVPLARMPYQSAWWIGVAQGAAIMPALSRSGLTLCAALGLGVDREDAVKYSFILSIPVILGAAVLLLKDLQVGNQGFGTSLWLGFAASAVTGYAAIRLMTRWIARANLRPFGYYALLLGVLVVLDQWVFHWV